MTGSARKRIALVGAGRMGRVHLSALRSSDAISVAAIVEPFVSAHEQLRDEGLVVYESVQQLLDAESARRRSDRGPHRPAPGARLPVCGSRDPDALRKARRGAPCGHRTGRASRGGCGACCSRSATGAGSYRSCALLREQIAAGELGRISLLACMQWDSELPSEQFRGHSGGLMVDMGVHEFDQVRWLLGEEFESIVAVPAGPSTRPRAAADPDSAGRAGHDFERYPL